MAGRKVLILMASPRKEGNTAALAARLAEGVAEAGGQAETVFLQDLAIAPCNGCNACHAEAGAGCVIEDDMQEVYAKMREAGALVLASPIYFFSVTAQLKAAIDRCYALVEGGPKVPALDGKPVGLLFTYGGEDAVDSGCVNAIRMFQDIFRFMDVAIAGTVHGSTAEGPIEKDKKTMDAAAALGRRLAGP